MPERSASAIWSGPLLDGRGKIVTESGHLNSQYSAGSRFEKAPGTNPEELIAGAQAGCFSMALAHELDQNGYEVKEIQSTARVQLKNVADGYEITAIHVRSEVRVGEIVESEFQEIAERAKEGCPVSRALRDVPIDLNAKRIVQ